MRVSRAAARRRWSIAAVTVAAATLGAACGDDSGETAGDGGSDADVAMVDFEPTGAFLASASWQLLVAGGGSLIGRLLTGERGRLVTALVSSAVIAVLAVALIW